MSAGRAGRSRWWLLPLVATASLLLFTGYASFIEPRPYFVTDIDAEQDYYYNARLIASGLPGTVHHPGTPVYYLSYALLTLSGDGLADAQRFFDFSYLVIALLASTALFAFGALCLRNVPAPVAALALSSIVAWPPFLTYLTILGADSFIVAVGMPTIAMFWRTMHRRRASAKELALGGAGIGLCLAVKMSFVPVAVALLAGYASGAVRRTRPDGAGAWSLRTLPGRCRPLLPVVMGLVGGYVVGIGPVLDRVAVIWARTMNRPDVAPAGSSLPAELSISLGQLIEVAPLWVGLAMTALIVAAIGFGRGVWRDRIVSPATPRGTGASDPEDAIDAISSGIFLALMAGAFGYTAAAATPISPGSEIGIRLRNMSPTALAVPFLILYAWGLRPVGALAATRRTLVVRLGMLGWAAVVVLTGATTFIVGRRAFIADHRARIAATEARFARLGGDGRIAFWTESSQDYLGPVSFHFWGNYRYANHAYDRLLLSWFPKYTFLRLRNIGRAHESGSEAAQAATGPSRYGRLGALYWEFRHRALADRQHYASFPGIVAGGDGTGAIRALALPKNELDEAGGLSVAELDATLRTMFGSASAREETIRDVTWLLFAVRSERGADMTHVTERPDQPLPVAGR